MTETSFRGWVREGHFRPDVPSAWAVWLGKHSGQRVVIKAEIEKVTRSNAQNRRYWSLVVPVAAEILSAGRTLPLSKDQAHEVLCYAFIGHEDTPLGPMRKRSSTLTTAEFAQFCERVEAWLMHDHQVVLDGID